MASEWAEYDHPEIISAVEVESFAPTLKFSEITDVDAEYDPDIDYAKKLKVKLLATGEFHAEEVPYRTGEKWLGLYRVDGSYSLMPTKIKKTRLGDDGLFDTDVSTSTPGDVVFLLRGAGNLLPGKIDTVFDSRFDGDNFGYFNGSESRVFGLGGMFWKLRVEDMDASGYFTDGTYLLLERTGLDPQVLRYLPNGCSDCDGRSSGSET